MSFDGKNPGILHTKGEQGIISSTRLVQGTHQATVDALAAAIGRKSAHIPTVNVGGTGYCIRAFFPARLLIDKLCDFARYYPDKALTRADLDRIVDQVNDAPANDTRLWPENKQIYIAGLPPKASRNVKNAAIAGCIHEEGHDLFTRQEKLDADEVAAIVMPRWNSVHNWGPYKGLLLQAANIFEDIYIERLLCAMFPGVRAKMAALQDFILTMEDKSREEAGADLTPISALMGLIRDLGLGYKTSLQREAIKSYREAHADVCDLILSGKGKPMMKEAIVNVSTKDAIEATRANTMLSTKLALDLVILMEEVGGAPPEPEDGEGEGQSKPCCPNCKAPASKLRSKAVKNDDTKIAITCTACGWQEIMDKPEPQEGGGEGQGEGGISVETGDPQDGNGGGGSGETIKFDDSDEADDENKAGDAQDGDDSEGGGEQDGEGSEGEGSEGEGSEGEGSEGEGSEGEDGNEIDGLWDGSRPDSAGDPGDQADSDASGQPGGSGAQWGAASGETQDEAQSPTLGELIESIENDGKADLMDYAQALGGETVREIEEFIKSDVKAGEAKWNPYSAAQDDIVWPKTGEAEKTRGAAITQSVREEAAFLLAKLRQVVLGKENVVVDNGTSRGRRLSAPNFARTIRQVKNGERPDRAYKNVTEITRQSLAGCIVMDESGSMYPILQDAGRAAAAIAMPLDALGAKVMVHGIRTLRSRRAEVAPNHQHVTNGHRSHAVAHDIIKGFDERFKVAEPRFSCLRAEGGTPLSDGIQFAMDNLEYRKEDNKVIFVITDGWPNGGHVPVINRQIRICGERGWHIVGIGVGQDAEYVQNLFPDSVYSPTVEGLPAKLVKKLVELMRNGTVKRRAVG